MTRVQELCRKLKPVMGKKVDRLWSAYLADSDADGKADIEQIIAHGYLAVPHSDPVDAILSDKRHTSWLGLDDVIQQIRNRYELYQRNMYEIEVSKCAAITSLYTHEAWHGPSDSKVEYSLNKRLDRLYKDQRDERTSLWQDVSKLRLALPENAQQYLTAYRKQSILEDEEGDGA